MERRTFLSTAATALAAATTAPFALAQEGTIRERIQQAREGRFERVEQRRQNRRGGPETTKIPIGVQLYSVRGAAQRDLPGTLEAIAKMGYDGVEFAGYYGREIADIRKMLDDTGLKCCGTHTGLGEFRNNFDRTVEIHKILGGQFMIVPGGIDHYLHDAERNTQIAEEFNKFSERVRAHDLYIGYHAHGGDARLVDGVPAWERFFGSTVQDVLQQMDIGNYKEGGGDPYAMIEKFPGRSKTVHLKETGDGRPIIGSGIVDWERVFELSETVGGVEWYVVEDEVGPDNLDRIEKCIIALREMGK